MPPLLLFLYHGQFNCSGLPLTRNRNRPIREILPRQSQLLTRYAIYGRCRARLFPAVREHRTPDTYTCHLARMKNQPTVEQELSVPRCACNPVRIGTRIRSWKSVIWGCGEGFVKSRLERLKLGWVVVG